MLLFSQRLWQLQRQNVEKHDGTERIQLLVSMISIVTPWGNLPNQSHIFRMGLKTQTGVFGHGRHAGFFRKLWETKLCQCFQIHLQTQRVDSIVEGIINSWLTLPMFEFDIFDIFDGALSVSRRVVQPSPVKRVCT